MKAEKNVQYQLKLSSRRKTVSIQVKKDGRVAVYAPDWLEMRRIREIITEKQQWIASQQYRMSQLYRKPIHHEYHEGEQFYLLGVPHTLMFDQYTGKRAVVDEQNRLIMMHAETDLKSRKQNMRDLYKYIGKRYIDRRLSVLMDAVSAHHPETVPSDVKFRSMKRRWGSCSHGGVITLSLRLFGAEPGLIDYVIIHELVHLHHFHHQQTFYSLFDSVMPDWRRRKNELERISGELNI